MIEKLKVVMKPEDWKLPVNELEMRCLKNLLLKVDELVDAVNELEKTAETRKFSKMEQRKWIGKACWFWDGNVQTKAFGRLNQIDPLDDGQNAPYQTNYGQWYEHCEPVKPEDDIIYKGGDND